MLTTCPECELQVSDKAYTCPHCGYPLKQQNITQVQKSKPKHKRLPNGFGRITNIAGHNLRKPFRAMVTIRKTQEGKFVGKTIGYFETYNLAYEALLEYNRNPYTLDRAITVQELYEKWTAEYFPTLKNESGFRNTKSAWSYCSTLYNLRAKDIRARHIKDVMENGTIIDKNGTVKHTTANLKSRIKSMWNLMLDYALEYEIVDRNYARTFDISKDVKEEIEQNNRGHIIFTDEELSILWKNLYKVPYVDVLLFQCYTGWRPQELGNLRMENVDLDNWIVIGGMKTKAGENRTVPIHSCIQGLTKKIYERNLSLNTGFFINCLDKKKDTKNLKFTYDVYKTRFETIIKELHLNPEHRMHDARKTFTTLAKRYKVDEYAIKRIVGHEIRDITERVYTERNVEWLKEEIEKIRGPII